MHLPDCFETLPEALYVEVTNFCNLKCTMCHHGWGLTGEQGFLDPGVFRRIVDDALSIPGYRPRIALHMNGEPLMHPNLPDMIRYASERGFYSFLHTNGTLLNSQRTRALTAAGISEISFSFEGEESGFYESIRVNAKHVHVVANIQEFLRHRGATKVVVEVLKFRNHHPDLSISKDFKALFPGADFKSFYASDWHGSVNVPGASEEAKTSVEKGQVCGDMRSVLSVSWNGKVSTCCIDYAHRQILGDMKVQSIREVWLGEQRAAQLHAMQEGRWKELELCRTCSAPYTYRLKQRQYETAHEEMP